MALHHVSLATGQKGFETMRAFYLASLKPLGYGVYYSEPGQWLGLAKPRAGPDLWLHCGGGEIEPFDGDVDARVGKTHVAFAAKSRAQVDEWYKTAMYVLPPR